VFFRNLLWKLNYRVMKKSLYLLVLLLAVVSCKDDEENLKEPVSTELKVGDVTNIETLFDQAYFDSELEYNLLKELDICDTIEVEGSVCAPCSAKNFKLTKFNNNKDLKDAFLLQVKALTVLKNQDAKLPMRHLIVFERENDELVKVNGFRGNLIATRESKSGIKDLIIRFYIPEDQAFLNCIFEWKDNRYHFKSVEAIDGGGGFGRVKDAVKDSVSKIVYQSLMDNTMLF
jgi:hypothetical protein